MCSEHKLIVNKKTRDDWTINRNDLTGMRFGRLVVLCRGKDYVSKSGRKRVQWTCLCDCGNIKDVLSDNLVGEKACSCGCLRKEITSRRQTSHGKSKSKLYGVWSSMKSRCYNSHNKHYSDYGERGVTVCDEWRNSYESFESWSLGNGYTSGMTIDRIDNNSGYSPDNCRWADRATQANNRRSNRLIVYNGETHNLTEWAQITGVNYKLLHRRLSDGWSVERALTTN